MGNKVFKFILEYNTLTHAQFKIKGNFGLINNFK